MKPGCLLAAGLLMAAALLPAAQAEDELTLRWSDQSGAKPMFRGVLNKDGAGMGAGAMLYPAPGLAGLFAAVLTHAAVNSSVQSAEMRKLQAAADEVLKRYAPALDAMAADDLLAQTRAALAPHGLAVRPGWVNANLELTPVFLMTQDRRAVLLDVAAQFNDGTTGRPRQLGMRVVSDPRGQQAEGQDDWASDESALKKVCVELLTRAVRHMLDSVDPARPAPTASAERTVRFAEGGALRMERSKVLEQRCGRALLLTLSDTLMSVPLVNVAVPDAECGVATAPAQVPAPAPVAVVAGQ
jgi:hypothetical protein